MNRKNVFKLLAMVFVVLTLTFLGGGNVYASEEIYFDEEGNLIYVTYDKKATTSVSYKAIGWILKRYDAPIDAEGQQYVIVRKIEYAVEDPENTDYLYCYFWSDKDEILDAVERVSVEWRRQLEVYGDMVYIDNVMTVCNSKVPLGDVDVNGTCTGEVYYTLDGIQNARPWAHPEYLVSYFDIKLNFPILYEPPVMTYVLNDKKVTTKQSSELTGVKIGSNAVAREIYDVSKAMPAGETLYFFGGCDRFHYRAEYGEYSVTVYIPIRVDTNYIRNWVDINGINQSETTVISRWYQIPRTVSYTTIQNFKMYYLDSVTLTSSLFEEPMEFFDKRNAINDQAVKRVYGGYTGHILINTNTCRTDNVVLSSNDYRKPAIPEDNYYEKAKSGVLSVQVRSDYLSIGDEVILSDEFAASEGGKPAAITQGRQTIYGSQVETSPLVSNGVYDDWLLTCRYIEKEHGLEYIGKFTNINAVNILTPVVCSGDVYGDKTINQAVEPSYGDLVLGGNISVSIDCLGTHKDYKGYGTRDYSEYVGCTYVKFEFPVLKDSQLISEGQWITMESGINRFVLPDTVRPGEYDVEYIAVARNGNESSELGNGYNGNISEHGAYSESKVNVIGRIYDYEVTGTEKYMAGVRDKDGNDLTEFTKFLLPDTFDLKEDKLVELSITTLGEISLKARLKGHIQFYYLNENGDEIIPVDLYEMGNMYELSEPCKVEESIEFSRDLALWNGKGGYKWMTMYELPDNFITVRKGEDISNIENDASILLKDGAVLIAFDFVVSDEGTKSLSYINEANYKKGYCNMWKQQGGTVSMKIFDKYVDIKDGTTFITEMYGGTKYDYEINGTH